MAEYTEKKYCRLCGSTLLTEVLDLDESPIGEDFILPCQKNVIQPLYPVRLMRCTVCGHLQLGHVVSRNNLYLEYLYETTRSLGLDKHFADYATKLASLKGIAQAAFAVDIGSNTGVLLQAMQSVGFRVMGVEPALHIAEQAQENGFPTYCGFFDAQSASTLLLQHGFADIITTNNCFANIDDLDAFMLGVDTLLAPSGYFVIETGYALDLLKNFIIDNIYHEHLSYFLLSPLRQFLQKHGFDVARVDRVPTKGGSIRVYAQRKNMVSSLPWDVQGLLILERELGFLEDAPYTQFAHDAAKRVRAICEMVEHLSTQGPVAAFGASVGSTALMYWAKIEKFIDIIVDDNVIMHGRMSPRRHIPIISPAELYENGIDTLLILAWRYRFQIMHTHKEFIERGRRVVHILPEVCVSQRCSV